MIAACAVPLNQDQHSEHLDRRTACSALIGFKPPNLLDSSIAAFYRLAISKGRGMYSHMAIIP
jgi:hypothetical protein